jgi:hypothetical protein
VQFSDFFSTRIPVFAMIYMKAEKSTSPFSPGSPFSGGQGTRRVDGFKTTRLEPCPPGEVCQLIGRERSQKFKNLCEGTQRKSVHKVENFRKAAPLKAPCIWTSKEIIESGSDRIPWSRKNFFENDNGGVLVGILSVAGPPG